MKYGYFLLRNFFPEHDRQRKVLGTEMMCLAGCSPYPDGAPNLHWYRSSALFHSKRHPCSNKKRLQNSSCKRSERRKSSLRDLSRRNRFLLRPKGAARETCKETLLRKASEADAHVVSFGTKGGGLRPSETSHGVYRQAGRLQNSSCKRFFNFETCIPQSSHSSLRPHSRSMSAYRSTVCFPSLSHT